MASGRPLRVSGVSPSPDAFPISHRYPALGWLPWCDHRRKQERRSRDSIPPHPTTPSARSTAMHVASCHPGARSRGPTPTAGPELSEGPVASNAGEHPGRRRPGARGGPDGRVHERRSSATSSPAARRESSLRRSEDRVGTRFGWIPGRFGAQILGRYRHRWFFAHCTFAPSLYGCQRDRLGADQTPPIDPEGMAAALASASGTEAKELWAMDGARWGWQGSEGAAAVGAARPRCR